MSRLSLVPRYWNTLRHLKPIQFYGRVRNTVYRPRPRNLQGFTLQDVIRPWSGPARPRTLLAPSRFRFLNAEREVTDPRDWNRGDWPKLWLYNLHYFDDLLATRAAERETWHRDLISRWIAENPPGVGNGWEPYPISLRIVNWCKWLLQKRKPEPGMIHSLACQADLLCRKPEYHLLGNHLWANYKALIFAGTALNGPRADKWLSFGVWGIHRQLSDQVLPDGGHFERSPMYHATLIEDLLDLVELDGVIPGKIPGSAVSLWRQRSAEMLRWLGVMSHPDGKISFFNDAAFDVALEVGALSAYARSIGIALPPTEPSSIVDLPDSGYCRLNRGDAVLLVDAAPVGPDYLPGHAHADTLSFEWSLGGHRVLVNGGTSTYELGDQRSKERGTAMHNTVQVDGQDSSEVWSGFRVARRARVCSRKLEDRGDSILVSASHDGYERLPGRVRHWREWCLGDGVLEVRDRLEGNFNQGVARFRLAPEVHAGPFQNSRVELRVGERRIDCSTSGSATLRLVEGSWHPEFGLDVPCSVIEVEMPGPELVTRFRWQ